MRTYRPSTGVQLLLLCVASHILSLPAVHASPSVLTSLERSKGDFAVPLFRRHGDDEHEHHDGSSPSIQPSATVPPEHGANVDLPPVLPVAPPPHTHGGHGSPKVEIDEAEIQRWHGVDPLSYYGHDWNSNGENARGMLIFHIISTCVAFFGLLPVAIVLRSSGSVNRRLFHVTHGLFLSLAIMGWAAALLYKKSTPDLYERSSHSSLGVVILVLSTLLTIIDNHEPFTRSITFIWKRGLRLLPSRKGAREAVGASHGVEYASLVNAQDPGRFVIDDEEAPSEDEHGGDIQLTSPRDRDTAPGPHSSVPPRVHQSYSSFEYDPQHSPVSAWSNISPFESTHRDRHIKRHSLGSKSDHSEITLHDSPEGSPPPTPGLHHDYQFRSASRRPLRSRLRTVLAKSGHILVESAHRLLVPLAFVELLSGIAIYTGACRAGYINGCAAHLIKGGIFWCYGILTFCRYIGAYADLGWAWNRHPVPASSSASSSPSRRPPSAEFVESTIIFLYGASNTWMERFGSAPGSAYSTKELQHISIAVMFWFAGALGMAMELDVLKKWLGAGAVKVVVAADPDPDSYGDHSVTKEAASAAPSSFAKPREDVLPKIEAPPSYSASFNPFPALVIGITGLAMSAHHQEYVFQVQIHELWGFLLTAFAVLRSLTYFFLFIRPAKSVLPSRPPTEALAAFFLASGGLVFMFSMEELTFWAMRTGRDDMMMFLNLAVAITCFVFCWFTAVLSIKGWAISRALRATRSRRQHHHARFLDNPHQTGIPSNMVA